MKRKIFAGILLVLLIVVPFINWQIGAILWMCAWLVFIFQNIFSRRTWKLGNTQNEDDETDTHPQNG